MKIGLGQGSVLSPLLHVGHQREERDIELDGKKLTQGDSFVYLEVAVCGDGKREEREEKRREEKREYIFI